MFLEMFTILGALTGAAITLSASERPLYLLFGAVLLVSWVALWKGRAGWTPVAHQDRLSHWLELEGSPKNHVIRFQVIAPTRPAMTTSSVMISWSTMPFAIVAATSIETKAPAKFSTAALATAMRGESARVETLVAIEFAVSWKPFVKSKKSATATTAQSVASTGQAFLTTMLAIVFAAVSQLSSASSSRS